MMPKSHPVTHRNYAPPRVDVDKHLVASTVKRLEFSLSSGNLPQAFEILYAYERDWEASRKPQVITDESPISAILTNARTVDQLQVLFDAFTVGALRRLDRDRVSRVSTLGESAWDEVQTALNKLTVATLLRGSVEQVMGGDDE